MNTDFIDVAESVATKMDMLCSRSSDEFTVQLRNGKFILSVLVKSDYDVMHFSCDLKLSVPKSKRNTILRAIAQVNERIWVGHFDFLSAHNEIVYSLTIPFMSSFVLDSAVVTSIYQTISEECDRFYNYFFMLIHEKGSEKDSDSSLHALFIDTCAEA